MSDPRVSGMSGITDKIVTVRHANEADIVNVREELDKKEDFGVDLSHSDVVVALEDERMIGFGILEQEGLPDGDGCLHLREKGRRQGIGLSIIRHLFEHAGPVRRVTAPVGASHYLDVIGFRRRKKGKPCGPDSALFCCRESAEGLAVYERPA